jgi:hypothetical protein
MHHTDNEDFESAPLNGLVRKHQLPEINKEEAKHSVAHLKHWEVSLF